MCLAIGLHLGLEGTATFAMYVAMIAAFISSVVWRPSLGIYLLVFSLPLQTVRYRLHVYPLGSQYLDILLLGSVLGLAIRKESIIPKSPVTKLLLLATVFYYFSLWQGVFFISTSLPLAIDDPRFSNWKNYVEMFFIAFLVASAVKKKSEIGFVILAMCFSLLLVNKSYSSAISDVDVSHFSEDARAPGPLGYAGVNGLAAFEAMLASFLLGLYACQKRVVVKLAILAVLTTCAYCLLYSFSRGGYLGLLAGALIVGVLKARHLLFLVLVVLICWATLLPASVQERITMTTAGEHAGEKFDASSEERLALWEDAISMTISKNPLTGTGFDTYQYMRRVGPYTDTHNYYLKVLAETGAIGIGLYLFMLARLFNVGRTLFRDATDPFWSSLGLGFLAVIASAVVLNFFGDRWTYQQVDGYLWVLLGCVMRGLLTLQEERLGLKFSAEPIALRNAEAVV